MGIQINFEMLVRVEVVCVFAYNDSVPLKKPVGLVARQE
jgi:hypothetical protein